DTTVTETNIHYPTDSSLLLDGVRVLTRTMKRIVEIGGKAGERARDRMRSVGRRVMEIARITRTKGQKQTKEKLQASYKRLLNATGQVVAQAKRIAHEVRKGVKKSRKLTDQLRLQALQAELERMIPLVQQVMRQTKARVFHNDLHAVDKLVSLFETATQIIRKGKSTKPTEFGRLIKIQEAENQIITDYEVCDQRPGGFHSVGEIRRSAPTTIRTRTAHPGHGCGFLFGCKRKSGAQDGASNEWPFRIDQQRVPNVGFYKKSDGFDRHRLGALDVKVGSVCSNDGHGLNRCRYR